jgi:hypothetical protein
VGAEQGLRVLVLRRAEHGGGPADLDDAPGLHDRDAVGDLGDHRQLVGDEDDRHAQLVAQVDEQLQQLRLDRDVERADRLVGDEHLGVDRQRPRHGDALALAAAELLGLAVGEARREVHALQRPRHERRAVLRARSVVHAAGLVQRLAHGHPRVQRRVGILEDHLHAPAQLAQLVALGGEHVGAAEADLAGVGLDEPDQAAGERRLAAARAAGQAEDLALAQREGHVVDRAVDLGVGPRHDLAERAAQGELLGDVLDFEDVRALGAHASVLLGTAAAGTSLACANGRTGQAHAWAGPTGSKSMEMLRHSGCAKAQRGAKTQPGSTSPSSGGWPGMPARGCARPADSSSGTDSSSARVYGCCGLS